MCLPRGAHKGRPYGLAARRPRCNVGRRPGFRVKLRKMRFTSLRAVILVALGFWLPSERGKAFGIESKTIDGNDPEVCYREIAAAMEFARSERKPFLLEALVSRVPVPAAVDVTAERLPPAIEATAYLR